MSYLKELASHPSWVCGLKLLTKCTSLSSAGSHPSWVCGLKLVISALMYFGFGVTPFVGVWIETPSSRGRWRSIWCHTLRGCVDWNYLIIHENGCKRRHTLRGCVDWNFVWTISAQAGISHTLRGCVDWNSVLLSLLKMVIRHTLRGCVDWNFRWCRQDSVQSSHTLRGCVDWNVKLARFFELQKKSHPSWVCGLKHNCWRYLCSPGRVTPFVGVWIETLDDGSKSWLQRVTPFVGVWIETWDTYSSRRSPESHPSWVCGLKLARCRDISFLCRSHPSWVCGLKQPMDAWHVDTHGHTLRGCVDWNKDTEPDHYEHYLSHPS